jgi:hypothetical protein
MKVAGGGDTAAYIEVITTPTRPHLSRKDYTTARRHLWRLAAMPTHD